MYIDLHVHTTRGSSDSGLTPEQLFREAQRAGLHGVCLTEHGSAWDATELEKAAERTDLLLVGALEVETDLGHVLALGLGSYVPGIHRLETLRRVADQAGAFLIAAHPFRRLFNPPPYNGVLMNRYLGRELPASVAEAASHPLFELVDEVEVANGASADEENRFAGEVARYLGRRGTGGSDAHSLHGLGRCVTLFEGPIRSTTELVEALRAGRFSTTSLPATQPRPPLREG